MRRFTKRGLSLAIATLVSGWSAGVFAASLGPVQVLSSPGQPLVAEIEIDNISADEASTLQVRVADSESFKKAQLEPSPLLSRLKFELVKGLTPEKATVRLTSAEAVPARYLDTLLEISWAGGRLVREYTLVMDRRVNESPALPTPAASEGTTASPEVPASGSPADPKARPVALKVPGAAEPGGTLLVKRGDTLGDIAKQISPTGAVNSTMAAIYMANKAAFIGGSIHKIREGAELSLPDRDAILSRNSKQALKVLAEFDDRADPYFQRMAATPLPSRSKAAEADASSGVIGKVKEEKAPSVDEDKLKVSRSKKEGAAGEAAAGNALAEELVIKEKAIKEANDRIAALEKNIADLQRLMELKAAAAPAAADAAKVNEAPKAADANKEATAAPADANKEGEAKPDGEPKPVEASTETALKPESEVKDESKKDGDHEESDEESDDHKKAKPWYKNGLLWGGLGGALAIGGGGAGFFFMKRRKQKLADADNHGAEPVHEAPHAGDDDLLNTGAGFDNDLAAAEGSIDEANGAPAFEAPTQAATQDEPLLESPPADSAVDLDFDAGNPVEEALLPPELEAGDAPQPVQPNAEFLGELDDFAAQADKASDALEQLKAAGPAESQAALDDEFDASTASNVGAAFDAAAGEKIDDALGKIDLDLPSYLGVLPDDPFGDKESPTSGAENDFAAAMNTAQMPAEREDLGAWQEMETKLDLAAAYIEIGDSDSSKELLAEVMKGGDAAQIAKAKDLMSRAD